MTEAYMQRAATKIGISPDVYREYLQRGQKWCSTHQAFHPRADFGARADRTDGLNYICRAANSDRVRAYHQRKAER